MRRSRTHCRPESSLGFLGRRACSGSWPRATPRPQRRAWDMRERCRKHARLRPSAGVGAPGPVYANGLLAGRMAVDAFVRATRMALPCRHSPESTGAVRGRRLCPTESPRRGPRVSKPHTKGRHSPNVWFRHPKSHMPSVLFPALLEITQSKCVVAGAPRNRTHQRQACPPWVCARIVTYTEGRHPPMRPPPPQQPATILGAVSARCPRSPFSASVRPCPRFGRRRGYFLAPSLAVSTNAEPETFPTLLGARDICVRRPL